MRPAKNQTIPSAAVHGLYWAMSAAFFGFITAYLVDSGFSDVEVGWISAVMYLVSTFVGPLTGYIADMRMPARRFLIWSFFLSVPFVLALPLVVRSIWMVFLIVPIVSVTQNLVCGVLDSMLVRINERSHNLDFPISRSSGSILYAVSCVVVGRLIAVFGYQAMFAANITMMIATVIAMLFLEYVPSAAQMKPEELAQAQAVEKVSFGKAFMRLLRCREYMVYIVAMTFFLYGLRLTLVFQANLVFPVGGTAEHVGWAGAVAAVFEVPFVLMLRNTQKFSKRWLAALLLGLGALKPFLFFLWPTAEMFVISQVFQAIADGFQLVFSLDYIKKNTPPELYSTANMIYTTVNMGLGCTMAAITGGYMLQGGHDTLLLVSTASMLTGAVVLAMTKYICKSKRNTNSEVNV